MLRSSLYALCAFAIAAVASSEPQPEAFTGLSELKHGEGQTHMVVAANPWASQAGLEILERGGSAVDAAITVQLVLGLVEPQSSGIGGGGFMLVADSGRPSLQVIDGRETAPALMRADHFLLPNGDRMPFFEALVGGRSVGVPGVIALMAEAHQQHGRLPWSDLFEFAIELAEDGFPISPRLHHLLESTPALAVNDEIRAYFFTNDGTPKPVGHRLKNPEYAEVLRVVAREGASGFYQGEIAKAIVDAVQNDPNSAGVLSLEDLENYRPVVRNPVCLDVWQYEICGAGPPSSGGITLLQLLGLIERQNTSYQGPLDPDFAEHFARASNLAFADRNAFIADPEFFDVPVAQLLDSAYLDRRALELVDAIPVAEPGLTRASLTEGVSPEQPSTTHFSVVDGNGMIVSMTSSIEMGFGSRVMARGFLLNNQLTDFNFVPSDSSGRQVANAVESGKRPRSSMSPTVVFDKTGNVRLVAGSPGGSRIINYTAQSILNVLMFDLSPAEAVAVPHFVSRNTGRVEVEDSQGNTELADELRNRGLTVVEGPQNSGLHLILVEPDGRLVGGADPRREGTVAAD